MTGRVPIRETKNMYGGTSANRNYQSTGRTMSNREGNLELYAHRKNQSKNELTYNQTNAQRRSWKNEKEAKEGLLQRYNSIDIQKKNILENSLPPKEKNKRGLSILNRENNNFVRDVSERVKRAPLSRLKSIGLYQEKEAEYEFSEPQKNQNQQNETPKSGVLLNDLKRDKRQNEDFKSVKVANKSKEK